MMRPPIHLGAEINIEKIPENEFLQGFEGNPFARIQCRSFNRMCTGSCGFCKKERETFQVARLQYWRNYFALERIRSGGDPDNLQDPLTPEQMLEAEIRIIGDQKKARSTNKHHHQMILQAMQERAADITPLQ